tara:strand:- start:518 stop:1798 length:1281 start_codon:yes stop_codon:yes gene_type:complete
MASSGGGGGGQSAYNSNIVTLDSGTSAADGINPFIEVIYTSPSSSGGTTVTTKTVITGAGTSTLTLNADSVGIQTVRCKVSHPTACNAPANDESIVSSTSNSPIFTKTAIYDAISAVNLQRSIITNEVVQDDDSQYLVGPSDTNLYLSPLSLQGSSDRPYRAICIFAPEENINVKITMAGSAGQSFNNNSGGAGGECVFTYTLQQNTEYMFLLGETQEPTTSLGRGGAGAYFYEKGRLLVACGGGGASGWYSGSGGDGAGPGIAGANGSGSQSGSGGIRVSDGQLSGNGELPSGTNGGKVESCTTGNYWANQGISPCVDVGQQQFRTFDGSIVSNTATLQRGYKSSGSLIATSNYGYRVNGGNSSSNINGTFFGGGGAGAYGGNATRSASSGGGGGSGYTDGSVTIISSSRGGNTSTSASANIEIN